MWAITLLAVWFGFVFLVSQDLLILGNREAKSPQVLCAVVKWGRERQLELLWTKVHLGSSLECLQTAING